MAVYRFPKQDTIEQTETPVDATQKAIETDVDDKPADEAADDDEDNDEPEFNEDDYEETEAMKACKSYILKAYDTWLESKQGKEVTGDYEWAKAENDEMPKAFAERISAKMAGDEKHKETVEELGGEDEFTDWVEAVMRYEGPDSVETAKSLDAVGYFNIPDEMLKAMDAKDYLTPEESVDVLRLAQIAAVREYIANPTRYVWDGQKDNSVPLSVQDFIYRQCQHEIDHLLWGDPMYIRAMHKLGSVDAYRNFIHETLESVLTEAGIKIESETENAPVASME